MLVMTILYPRSDDSTFDMEYYTSSHMPMVAECFGEAGHGWGAASIAEGKYRAMGWVMVTDQESFDAAMAAHGGKIMGDVPNYTNTRPAVLVGEATGGSQ